MRRLTRFTQRFECWGDTFKEAMLFLSRIECQFKALTLSPSASAVKVSETGWPSKGNANEFGASPENARIYNGNLLSRIEQRQGTPANLSVPIDVFFFALFYEDLKPGPAFKRDYGLDYLNGTHVYNIGYCRVIFLAWITQLLPDMLTTETFHKNLE